MTTVTLSTNAVRFLRLVQEHRDSARLLASNQAIAGWYEESRSYAAEFATAVLLENPSVLTQKGGK